MNDEYPLINRKIQIPQRPQTLLRRERLVGFLHSNLNHKLVLISAGAGYGKTSLLIDYAHDAEVPVCWYSLDAGDAHVPTFVEYLVASIRQRFPSFGDSVMRALRSFTGPNEDVEPFIRLLINEIQEHVDDYAALILDDYQEVLDSEPVNALVDGLLRYMPDNMHLILASRAIPRRLTLTRLAAREEIVGMGVRQLKFSREEIGEVLGLRGMTDLEPEQLDALSERSEGWITGILLAAQTGWTETLEQIISLSGSLDSIFDYLAQEVLAQQPEEIQAFLLSTSVLEEMSPPICDALLEIGNSAMILRSLAEQGLFTFEISSSAGWYQYHQLFREFLVAKLERERPADYRDLCLKEAQIMANQGRWAWAIDGYLSGQAYGKAADSIEIVAQDYFDAGRFDQMQQWIDDLPETIVSEHPRLLHYSARINSQTGSYGQAELLLESAHRIYTKQDSAIGIAQVLVQWAIVQRLQERFTEAIETCQKVLEIVGESRDPLSAIKAYQNLGICYQILGDPVRGQQEMRYALEIAQNFGDSLNAASIAHDLGNSLYIQGDMDEARQYLHQALMHWRKVGNPGALAMTLQGLGVIHHHLGQYAEAQNRFEESLEKARHIGNRRLEAYALVNNADLHKDQGRLREALMRYEKALDVAASVGQSGLMLYILAAMGDAYRLDGNDARARQVLTEALDQGERQGINEPVGLSHLAFGALAVQQEQPEQAQHHLKQAYELIKEGGSQRDLARVDLQLALLACQIGDEEALRMHLTKLGQVASRLDTDQFIVAEGTAIIPLLAYISEWRIEGLDAVRLRAQLEELFPTVVIEPRLRVVHRDIELELLALNGGQVIYKGSVVRDFESSVARTMAFLLAEHPAGLAKERISDMLWHDTSQSRGESLFHSTMYRLRKALDKRTIIQHDSIYRLNPDIKYRYDVAEFQRLVRLGYGQDETAHLARINAIDLYRNGFLEGYDYPWCQDISYALQHEMIRLLIKEANYLCHHASPQQAEALFLRVLALDELDEQAHRGVIWCRAKMGDAPGAMRQYRECARILEDEMDLPPRPDTQELFETIHQGRIPSEPW